MDKVNLASSISNIVAPIVKYHEGGFDGALVSIRMEPEIEDEDDDIESTFYHMIFQASENYVTVLACGETDSRFVNGDDEFKIMCHHDSAWRHDSFCELNEILKNKYMATIIGFKMFNLKGTFSKNRNGTFIVDVDESIEIIEQE